MSAAPDTPLIYLTINDRALHHAIIRRIYRLRSVTGALREVTELHRSNGNLALCSLFLDCCSWLVSELDTGLGHLYFFLKNRNLESYYERILDSI